MATQIVAATKAKAISPSDAATCWRCQYQPTQAVARTIGAAFRSIERCRSVQFSCQDEIHMPVLSSGAMHSVA